VRKLLIAILVLFVLGVLVAACTGAVHVPVLSSALGMDKAASIGEQPANAAALKSLQAQLGVTTPSPVENYTLASKHTFSGSVPLDQTVPEATVMALPEVSQPAPGISDVHIRFHDGYVETSAMVDLAPWGYPFSGPIDATWHLDVTGPQAATVKFDSLKFGAFGVPGFIVTKAEDAINGYLATRLPQMTGLDMQKITFVEGGVDYAGSIPKTYEAAPPVAGQLP
jgi:hypothetical protein